MEFNASFISSRYNANSDFHSSPAWQLEEYVGGDRRFLELQKT
jgi:hypothetical protein